jgi:hypothetical protein
MSEQTTTTMESAAVRFGGLSNEEILIIYFRFKKYVDDLEESFEKKQISKPVDTPFGKGAAIIKVTQEQIDEFRNTDYYKLSVSVVNKLKPIVELLLECDDTFKKLADELR